MTRSISKKQERLSRIMKATSGTINAEEVVSILNISSQKASRILADWHKQGAIRRVAHGLYVPIMPSSIRREQVLENPWVLVPKLFEPGYVGGWSALEHWEMTEQIFRSVCVMTIKKTSYSEKRLQGINFHIKHISKKRLFGTKAIWLDGLRIQISDPHKTILDIIDDPQIGGGLQHVYSSFLEYSKIFQLDAERQTLIDYAVKTGNGALFKKLGYIAELAGFKNNFLKKCKNKMTSGNAFLDKNIENKKLVTRWRLWVPEGLVKND